MMLLRNPELLVEVKEPTVVASGPDGKEGAVVEQAPTNSDKMTPPDSGKKS
jgi:hypothetical protein